MQKQDRAKALKSKYQTGSYTREKKGTENEQANTVARNGDLTTTILTSGAKRESCGLNRHKGRKVRIHR